VSNHHEIPESLNEGGNSTFVAAPIVDARWTKFGPIFDGRWPKKKVGHA